MALSESQLAQLKIELDTDPITMGYNSSNTKATLRDLNKASRNVGGETGEVKLTRFENIDVYDQFDETEYNALIGYDLDRMKAFIAQAPDVDPHLYRAQIRKAFGNASVTWAAVQAMAVVPLSRAEVLFGVDLIISRQDIINYRQL
jgi:hypothetical protein